MLRFVLMVLLLLAPPVTAMAQSCGADGDLSCLVQSFQRADGQLNAGYTQLTAKLTAPRREAIRTDELAWLRRRDQSCMRHEADRQWVDLACAARETQSRTQFLTDRYRDCVSALCTDLDFYNAPVGVPDGAQDGVQADAGPKLVGHPAISKYHGADAGYIAVYAHDAQNALYPVGGDIYVAGFVRLRGHYASRIFQPAGYEGQDISAAPEFKALANALFPNHRGGAWAGGDTGGLISR